MKFDKRTITVIAASTAIGYVGDVIMISLAKKQPNKPFKIEFPKGKDALQLLVVGIVSGVAIDYAVQKIAKALQTDQEKSLLKLVEAELERIVSNERANKEPVAILWKDKLFAA